MFFLDFTHPSFILKKATNPAAAPAPWSTQIHEAKKKKKKLN